MRLALATLLAATLTVSAPERAEAYRFGTEETIHKIEDVKLKGAKNEDLFLGYMVRVKNFLLGLYLEDAGYVLGVKGESKRYYHMPQGEELARFQRAGFLPDPLPRYEIGTLDYVFGYSLWWGLALAGLAIWWGDRKKKQKAAAANPGPAAPGAPPTRPPTA